MGQDPLTASIEMTTSVEISTVIEIVDRRNAP